MSAVSTSDAAMCDVSTCVCVCVCANFAHVEHVIVEANLQTCHRMGSILCACKVANVSAQFGVCLFMYLNIPGCIMPHMNVTVCAWTLILHSTSQLRPSASTASMHETCQAIAQNRLVWRR